MTNMRRRAALCALAVLCAVCMTVQAANAGSRAQEALESMTLRQKFGQMLMMSFRYWDTRADRAVNRHTAMPELNDTVRELIGRYHLGSIILFSENTVSTEQTVKLVRDMRAAGAGDIPMWFGIDQEGGYITRLGEGTVFPGNMALGATRDGDAARACARATGEELKALGIDIDFAPVLDVNVNPDNPVINVRSFSSDKELVAKMGVAAIQGYRDSGVVAAVKHFPGHGNTATDSHTGLPSVGETLEELKSGALYPFQQAIDAGVPMVMTTHIQFPAVETERVQSKADGGEIAPPATLSREILTGLLREQMGFDGVIVTDAMNMDAIAAHFGRDEAIVRAINAGADMLCMPVNVWGEMDVKALEDVYVMLEKAVADGVIAQSRIDEAVLRILTLKEEMGLFDAPDMTLGGQLQAARETVGGAAHRALERETAARAVTVLRDESLPFAPSEKQKVLFLTSRDSQQNAFAFTVNRLKAEGKIADFKWESLSYDGAEKIDEPTLKKVDAADYVVLLVHASASLDSDNWNMACPRAVLSRALAGGKPIAVVSTQQPYDAALYPDAPALLVCYNPKGVSKAAAEEGAATRLAYGPNIPAALEVIFGAAQAGGTLPVDIPSVDETGAKSQTEYAFRFGDGIAAPQ